MLTAEEWLKENCKTDDWNGIEDQLKDSLWTNNVIKYMHQYHDYAVSYENILHME